MAHDLGPTNVLTVLAIFYDEMNGDGASDLLPNKEGALFKWAAGDGRDYVRSQGMATLEDGRALAFDPDGRAHRLIKAA
jgi:hypothetical protein